jgi:putative chitinase
MILTAAIIKQIAKNANDEIAADLAQYLPSAWEKYGINTKLRVANFLGQAAHESDGFKTLHEYWGPTAAQKKYEGRKDLGNVNKGDGSLFRGRGIFQVTGRANYETIGKAIGVDLITDPNVAATGKVSVLTACEYWDSHKLNDLADHDDVTAITKKINGGTNGLDARIQYVKLAKAVVGEIFSAPTPPHPDEVITPVEELHPLKVPLMKKGDNNEMVKVLQAALTFRGFPVSVDGDFGPKTEAAVKAYQKQQKFSPADGLVTVPIYRKITG